MLPFSVTLRSGLPIHKQVVFAVTRSVVSGQLRPGDPFPSVRTLSQELRINPNTAHKIVAALIEGGILVAQPGIGTRVADTPRPMDSGKQKLILGDKVERLVVEARHARIPLGRLLDAVRRHWKRIVKRGLRREGAIR